MTQKSFPFAGELIGKEVVIESSTNTSYVGLVGTIIDETCNTLVINSFGKRKTVLKSNVVLTLSIGEKDVLVNGLMLQKRPEARIKQ
tara:strand:+ start:1115 stop:1375 length:261 start_codon:yes stop_codon:yes gene_type:complete